MSRSSKNDLRDGLPYSGEIIGAVVKALDLDHGVLRGRTARRFFSGRPVSENSRAEIFAALGETTIKLGFVPKTVALERYGNPMSQIVGEAFETTSKRWDAMLAMLQGLSAPIHDRAIAVDGFLRLVVVDLALRVFASARLAGIDPPDAVTPNWAKVDSQQRILRCLVSNAGLTREQLADRLGISDTSVDNWLDGKVRPTRKNVTAIATALAKGSTDTKVRQLEHDILRHLALAHLTDLLAGVIGRTRVLDLSAALYRFANLITENVKGMQRPPIEQDPTAEVVALMYGTAHPSTIPLLEDLSSAETDRDWKRYIMAAAVSWDAAFQSISVEAGLPRTAAGLAQDIAEVSKTASNRTWEPEDAYESDAAIEIRERLTRVISVDSTVRLIHGGPRALTRHWKDGIVLRLNLVRDFPTNPEAHFELGSYLGKVGELSRRRDLVDNGINECKIASALLPEWDAPAVEPAIMLANVGAYEESLRELNWAKSVLPATTPHLHYCFGYTLMMLKRFEEALPHFEEVLKFKPDYVLALRDAAHCSFKLGDHKNGPRFAKRARKFGDPFEYDLWRRGTYSSSKSRLKR